MKVFGGFGFAGRCLLSSEYTPNLRDKVNTSSYLFLIIYNLLLWICTGFKTKSHKNSKGIFK